MADCARVTTATVIPPGGGEVIGDSLERRVEILSDDDTVHATWSRFGPGRAGADLHIHRRHTDLFYVLDGELTIRLGTEGVSAALGSWLPRRPVPDPVAAAVGFAVLAWADARATALGWRVVVAREGLLVP